MKPKSAVALNQIQILLFWPAPMHWHWAGFSAGTRDTDGNGEAAVRRDRSAALIHLVASRTVHDPRLCGAK